MNIKLQHCKREDYIKAWNFMYFEDKNKWNKNPIFDGVNPSLNKTALATETDNFCIVAFDADKKTKEFKQGFPVGVFSFVVTPAKIIGKQFVVDPDYHKQGIGTAMILELENELIKNGYEKYYIGCSQFSAKIYKNRFGLEPFSSSVEHDMYKFNVDLKRSEFKSQYKKYVKDMKFHIAKQKKS